MTSLPLNRFCNQRRDGTKLEPCLDVQASKPQQLARRVLAGCWETSGTMEPGVGTATTFRGWQAREIWKNLDSGRNNWPAWRIIYNCSKSLPCRQRAAAD